MACIAPLHLAANEIGARLDDRGGEADPSVVMAWGGVEVLAPHGRDRAHILLLVLRHQTIADVVDLQLAPVRSGRVGLDVVLYVSQQLGNVDPFGRKRQLGAVAEAILQHRVVAAGLYLAGFELSPVALDLVKALLLPLVAAVAVPCDALAPGVGGPFVLAAVLVDAGELVQGLLADPGIVAGSQRLEAGDEVVCGREGEALDAGGQAGQCFAIAQRGEREAVLPVVGCFVVGAAQVVGDLNHRLYAELSV